MALDREGLHDDCQSCITTWSRHRMNPLAPTVQDIDIADIAHALSKQVRYNGHTLGHLSVARHSIWVADQVLMWGGDETQQLWGLLHDAAEAYLGDLVRPLKHTKFGEVFLLAEAELEATIAEAFRLPYPMPDVIKEADRVVLMEKELGDEGLRWSWTSTAEDDERSFLAYYAGLWHYHKENLK